MYRLFQRVAENAMLRARLSPLIISMEVRKGNINEQ